MRRSVAAVSDYVLLLAQTTCSPCNLNRTFTETIVFVKVLSLRRCLSLLPLLVVLSPLALLVLLFRRRQQVFWHWLPVLQQLHHLLHDLPAGPKHHHQPHAVHAHSTGRSGNSRVRSACDTPCGRHDVLWYCAMPACVTCSKLQLNTLLPLLLTRVVTGGVMGRTKSSQTHSPSLLQLLQLLLRPQHLLLYVICLTAALEPAASSMMHHLGEGGPDNNMHTGPCTAGVTRSTLLLHRRHAPLTKPSAHPRAAALLPPSSGASWPFANRTHTVPFLFSGSSCLHAIAMTQGQGLSTDTAAMQPASHSRNKRCTTSVAPELQRLRPTVWGGHRCMPPGSGTPTYLTPMTDTFTPRGVRTISPTCVWGRAVRHVCSHSVQQGAAV